ANEHGHVRVLRRRLQAGLRRVDLLFWLRSNGAVDRAAGSERRDENRVEQNPRIGWYPDGREATKCSETAPTKAPRPLPLIGVSTAAGPLRLVTSRLTEGISALRALD